MKNLSLPPHLAGFEPMTFEWLVYWTSHAKVVGSSPAGGEVILHSPSVVDL